MREWLAVLARTVQLQDGVSILELDRVLDSAPADVEAHQTGLTRARHNRIQVIASSTARILSQMNETAQRANASVLLNPFDSPSAVKSSNIVAVGVLDFRRRLGIESGDESEVAKRWRQAVAEVRDNALSSASDGVRIAGRFGAETFDRATEAFRAVDSDGDGIADRPRAAAVAEKAGAAVKDRAFSISDAVGSMFTPKGNKRTPSDREDSETATDGSETAS